MRVEFWPITVDIRLYLINSFLLWKSQRKPKKLPSQPYPCLTEISFPLSKWNFRSRHISNKMIPNSASQPFFNSEFVILGFSKLKMTCHNRNNPLAWESHRVAFKDTRQPFIVEEWCTVLLRDKLPQGVLVHLAPSSIKKLSKQDRETVLTEPVKVAVKLLGISTQLFEPTKLYSLLNLFFFRKGYVLK